MSIAVERVQNYYQYKDAEAKFYQLLKSDDQEVVQVPPPSQEQVKQDSKPKKSKKNKKKEPAGATDGNCVATVESAQVTKDEDNSVKTDSGIADEPLSEAAAAKKKSKSKKQREKKAAAALAAQQLQQQQPPSQSSPSEPIKEKIVIDLTTANAAATVAAAAKPKDKKKKPKNTSAEQKTKEDTDKNGVSSTTSSNLVSEIAKARQHIKSSLERVDGASGLGGAGGELLDRISSLEKDNSQLHGVIDGLQKLVISLEGRLNKLEGGKTPAAPAKSAPAPAKPAPAAADDDDVDLFGSDEEDDEEAEKIKADRLKAYAEKKSKKPALIAKSSILLDCKPWDDETDMAAMEKQVRTIVMDGLLWGASKLVPLAYGIKKLQILCVIEDEKVSVDELQEKICEFEDFVQSVDIAAFQKI